MADCIQCRRQTAPYASKYCSNKCQSDHVYELYIERWKRGQESGSRGIVTQNTSGHLKRYLVKKFGDACILCGWSIVHPITGKVPLELDHIDGNADNNLEVNLRLLCPNCHALTPNFRNLNRGKGRSWRKAKYLKSE